MKKSIKDFNTFSENPFHIEGLISQTRVNQGDKKVRQIVDVDTGEVMNVLKLESTASTVVVDPLEFTKVFKASAPNMQNMTVAGLKVWVYITYHLKPNHDFIFLNVADIADWCNYTQVNQVYSGLVNLLLENFIAKGDKNIYWINPNFYYNGKRQLNKTYKIKE